MDVGVSGALMDAGVECNGGKWLGTNENSLPCVTGPPSIPCHPLNLPSNSSLPPFCHLLHTVPSWLSPQGSPKLPKQILQH